MVFRDLPIKIAKINTIRTSRHQNKILYCSVQGTVGPGGSPQRGLGSIGPKAVVFALIASGLTEPVVDPTPLTGDMLRSCYTYYWQVETNNCCDQILTSPVWSFRTGQLGDLDGSGSVSLGDFGVFASYWLDVDCTIPDWCNASDIDHSGSNDQVDLSILVEQWLRTCP